MDQLNKDYRSRSDQAPQNSSGMPPRRRPVPLNGTMRGMQRPQQKNDAARSAMHQQGRVQNDRVAGSNKYDHMRSEVAVKILGKISAICVFMLFFGMPLFFLNFTYQGLGFEKQYYFYLWTFIGIVALIAQGMMGGKIEIRRTTLDIPLSILWIVALISTLFSVDKYHSLFGFFGNPVNGLISISAIILAYYLIVSYVSKERINLIWYAVVTSGSLVVVWSFLATMRLIPATVLQYISPSLTGSFTSLAIFLGMMLPIFIISFTFLDQGKGSVLKKKIMTVLLLLIILVDMITLSALFGYAQWVTILGAIGLLLVFTISRLVKVTQKTSSMTILVFLGLFFLWMWNQPIITRIAIQPEATMKYNLSFDVAKEAVKNRPIFGSGPGTYGYTFSLHRPKDLNKNGQYDMRFYSDRGMFMESISTTGIAGMIALTLVVLTYLSTSVYSFLHADDEEMKVVSLGLFLSSIIALFYALFWAVDGMIILYGVLMGALTIGLLRGSLDSGDQKITLSVSASPQHALSFAFLSILVAVGVIFGFVTLGKMFVADIHAGNALKARAVGDFVRSSDLFQRAIVLNGNEGRYYTIIGQYGLDLANIELAKPAEERDDELVARYISGATGASSTGKELMPNDVLSNETKGFVFENSGGLVPNALSSALSSYQRASELEPFNPYFDIAIGKLKLVEAQSKGESAVDEKTEIINEAKTYFDTAKEKTTFEYEGELISFFAPAHYYTSVVEEALGNIDVAIESMTTALQVTSISGGDQQQTLSRQINYGFNLARLLQVRGTDDDIKNAESLLLNIIGVNDQEINSYLSLGLLYERQGRRDEAISEYKKILALLPEDDEKARQNIQSLIDTIEQGGSNVDTNKNTIDENDTVEDVQEDNTVQSDENENISILIVNRGGANDQAEIVKNTLFTQGIDAEIREEGDATSDGVMVMYGGQLDRVQRDRIVGLLEGEFENVASERNDEDVATYNHDLVVVVSRLEQNVEESEE
jgi:tetratricopeptide (TPR) repeat protein